MGIDLEKVKQTVTGRWDLVVDNRKFDDIWGLSGVRFKLGTIHEVAKGNTRIDRDSLVAISKGRKGGEFLVQACLQEFRKTEDGFEAEGIGYTENGDSYEGGSPAWVKMHAVRR